MTETCPLCCDSHSTLFYQDKRRDYLRCNRCQLVFVPRAQRLSLIEEKGIYDLHQNDIADQGYRRFLNRIYEPLKAKLLPNAKGLDFGCGPGPALADMFAQDGFDMAIYDPIYANDKTVLNQKYDFITATEAIEHFYEPATEWQLLLSLLKPKGWLGIMTKLVIDQNAFANWHYKNDLTHVCFFSQATFDYLAQRDGLSCQFIGKDVILFQQGERNTLK